VTVREDVSFHYDDVAGDPFYGEAAAVDLRRNALDDDAVATFTGDG
jgi:hypothetical protein